MSALTISLIAAVFVPLSFWLFDTLVKLLGSVSIEDVGADLCLFSVSFNATTLLGALAQAAAQRPPAAREEIAALASVALVTSLLLYVLSVLIIAPAGSQPLPKILMWLKSLSWKISLTVAFGFISTGVEVGVYVWLLMK